MARLMQAGITLPDAVSFVSEGEEFSDYFRNALQEVYQNLMNGEKPAFAFSYREGVFPYIFCLYMKILDETGRMIEVFSECADYYHEEEQRRQEIIGALLYPSIVLLLSILIVLLLNYTVIPMFSQSLGGELPRFTSIILGMMNGLPIFLILLVLFFTVAVILFQKRMKEDDQFRYQFGKKILQIPVLGKQIRLRIFHQFYTQMHMLIRSSIPLPDAIEACANACSNYYVAQELLRIETALYRGQHLSETCKMVSLFTEIDRQMIHVSEHTGDFEGCFYFLQDWYKSQHERSIKKLTIILEPVMMIGLGLFVAIIMGALMLPILDYYQNMGALF